MTLNRSAKRRIFANAWPSSGWLLRVATSWWTSPKSLSVRVVCCTSSKRKRALKRVDWVCPAGGEASERWEVNAEKFDNVSFFPTRSLSPPGHSVVFTSFFFLFWVFFERFCFFNLHFVFWKLFNVFRTSDGKLHLLPEIGKIPFVDATLIEDPTETSSCDDDDGTLQRQTSPFFFRYRHQNWESHVESLWWRIDLQRVFARLRAKRRARWAIVAPRRTGPSSNRATIITDSISSWLSRIKRAMDRAKWSIS